MRRSLRLLSVLGCLTRARYEDARRLPPLDTDLRQEITEFYEKLFPLLTTHGTIKRCFVLSTASYKAPEDTFSLKWWFGVWAVRIFLGTAYQEINGMSRAVAALPVDKVGWTLFRYLSLSLKLMRSSANVQLTGCQALTMVRPRPCVLDSLATENLMAFS